MAQIKINNLYKRDTKNAAASQGLNTAVKKTAQALSRTPSSLYTPGSGTAQKSNTMAGGRSLGAGSVPAPAQVQRAVNANGYAGVKNAVQPATVYTQNKTPYTGYIIGGKTYTDPQGSRRIPSGNQAAAQAYAPTAAARQNAGGAGESRMVSGSVPTGGSYGRIPLWNETRPATQLYSSAPAGQPATVQAEQAGGGKSRPTQVDVYSGGNKMPGYLIDGKTYLDPNGAQRIAEGSSVVLPDGRIYNLQNGVGKTSSATQVPYTGPDGRQYTGYLINGRTYTDPQGLQRVPIGSRVKVNGKEYVYYGENGGPSQVSYYTPDGQRHQGYVIGGQTYTDPNGQNRIPDGAVVTVDGGSYLYNSGTGGVPNMATILNNYQASADSMMGQLQDYGAARQAAIDAAVARNTYQLESQKGDVLRNATEANRQAELAYITASNPYGVLAQQNEALGLGDSGYAESTMAQLGNTYQQALSSNELAKNEALAKIDLAIQDARYNGDIESANALAELSQMIIQQGNQNANAILNASMSGLSMANEDNWRQREWERQQEQDAWAKSQAQWQQDYTVKQDDRSIALTLISHGIVNQELANALGISLEEAQKLAKQMSGGNQGGGRAYRSGGGGGSSAGIGSNTAERPAPTPAEEAAYITIIQQSVARIAQGENLSPEDIAQEYENLITQGIANGKLSEETATALMKKYVVS